MNASHGLMFAGGLLLGAAIPSLIRWATMPLVIAGLLVALAFALAMLARRAGIR